MRWWKGSLTLILIASVVFLSTVRIDANAQNSQQPQPNRQTNQLHKGESTQNQKPTAQESATRRLFDADAYRHDSQSKTDNPPTSPSTPRSQWWFDLLLIVFTGGLFGVGVAQCFLFYCQYKAGRLNARATLRSAYAAKTSNEVARLALQADRPYLLVEEYKLTGYNQGTPRPFRPYPTNIDKSGIDGLLIARFTLRNYGKGPALVEEIVATLTTVTSFDELPPAKDFEGCRKLDSPREAVQAGQPIELGTDFLDAFLSDDIYEAVRGGDRRIVVYGCARYRDVFKKSYETGFCWVFNIRGTESEYLKTLALSSQGIPGFALFGRGPKTHNYRE